MCVAAPWHGSSEWVQCLLLSSLVLLSELSPKEQSTLLKYVMYIRIIRRVGYE